MIYFDINSNGVFLRDGCSKIDIDELQCLLDRINVLQGQPLRLTVKRNVLTLHGGGTVSDLDEVYLAFDQLQSMISHRSSVTMKTLRWEVTFILQRYALRVVKSQALACRKVLAHRRGLVLM